MSKGFKDTIFHKFKVALDHFDIIFEIDWNVACVQTSPISLLSAWSKEMETSARRLLNCLFCQFDKIVKHKPLETTLKTETLVAREATIMACGGDIIFNDVHIV